MKCSVKVLIVLFISFLCKKAQAQINIQSFPSAGDTVLFTVHHTPTTPLVFSSFDQTGINHIWDFSTWNIGTADTLVFDQAAGNSFAENFPEAEFSILHNGTVGSEFFNKISYYKTVGNDIIKVGAVINANSNALIPLTYLTNQTFLSFPVNTGNSFNDTTTTIGKILGSSLGLQFDSVMQKSITYRHDTIDGSGQLQFGGYGYDNLYRKKITDTKIDSMFFYTQPNGWQFLETKQEQFVNVLWLNENDFITAWMEVRNDTAYNLKSLKYNPSVRLEFVNIPAEGLEGEVIQSFEVRAYNISDNSLCTMFNDSVHILTNTQNYSSYGIMNGVKKAVLGVATFNNLSFTINGNIQIVAVSDTTESSPLSTITIHARVDSLAIINLSTTQEAEVLPAFEVHVFNSAGNPDMFYTGNVNIGKLSGSGKMTGTLSKPVNNGIAIFDDIKFNHQDTYNIIAWLPTAGSLLLDSEYISISNNPDLNWVSTETDTISKYVDRASFFVWTGNADGYLSGTSREWYDEIGQHFDFSQKGLLTKVIFYAAQWQQINTITNDTYKVKVYNSGVSIQQPPPFQSRLLVDSLCLELLGEQSFTPADFHPTDFFVRTPSVITFNTPIEVYSDFIISLEVNNELADDTIVLWTSTIGEGMGEHRTSRRMIENYPGVNPGWIHDNDWRPQYDVDNMIMPIIEVDTMDIVTSVINTEMPNANLYPNPTSGEVSFTSTNPISKIELTDLSGRLVYSHSTSSNLGKIALLIDNLSNGIYTAQIYFSNTASVNEKLVILKP